jgi:drug/metabolite transporter (DMT)-like permease
MTRSTAAIAPTTPVPWTEYLLLLALASVWGASYTFIKIGVETIPPLTLIASRTLVAGAVLLTVMRWRGVSLPRDRTSWKRFAFQALMNSVLPFTLIAWAERTIDAGSAAILNSTTPIFTFLITIGITHHEPAGLRKLAGIVLGLAGICLVIGVEALDGIGIGLAAQLAVVLATICYAVAAIFGRNFKGLDPMVPAAAGSLLAGSIMLLPLSLAVDRPWTLSPSGESLLAVLGLAIVSTALAFTIYFRLLRTLGSVGTTAQAYLRVPIGVGIGVFALGETVAPTAAMGLVCVVLGVAAMTVPERKPLSFGAA